MRKRVLEVLLCASLMVGALPGVALAERPFGTFTVVCPNFQTGQGEFTQILPEPARQGSEISNANVNERTGSDCVIRG
jgi:hypothetical protein